MTVLDTLAVARRLEQAGMDRRQAEAVAEAAGEAAEANRADLVTKADLKSEIAALEARLTWRMVGIVLAQGALVVALLKVVP